MTHIFPHSRDLADVEYEWEKVKLAYQILKDKTLRLRYERSVMLSDPGAAVTESMKKAAFDFVGWGLSGVGKGIMKAGEAVTTKITKNDKA